MFILAHLIAGLIIGKIFGNYAIALIGALSMDLDHLVAYTQNKIILSPKKLWQAVTSPEDPYGNKRNFLHSFFAWLPISAIAIAVNFGAGLVFSLAYLSHLLLDMIDSSDFHPFYPIKLSIRGPIVYLSKYEIMFTTLMFFIFFII